MKKLLIAFLTLILLSGCATTSTKTSETSPCDSVQIQPYCSGANAVTVKNIGSPIDKLTVKVYRITDVVDTYESDGLETNEFTAVDLGIGAMTKLKVIPGLFDKSCEEKSITMDGGC